MKIYLAIETLRGIVVEVKAFTNETNCRNYAERWARNLGFKHFQAFVVEARNSDYYLYLKTTELEEDN